MNNIIEFLVGIVVGNSNKLQKKVWKENSIECIQILANDIGYIRFSLKFILKLKFNIYMHKILFIYTNKIYM